MRTWAGRVFLLLALAGAAFFVFKQARTVEGKIVPDVPPNPRQIAEVRPQAFPAARFAESAPVSSLGPESPDPNRATKKIGRAELQGREIPNQLPFRQIDPNAKPDATVSEASISMVPMPGPELTFEGVSSNDNAAAFGARVFPPDTTGDVGPNHYVQAVNLLTRVFNKSGTPLTPPFKLSSLFAPLGTGCALRDDGDPIVLYDPLADRWILSQFCTQNPPFRQMIAVSKTGDPTGGYYLYEFIMPNFKLNDYPKFGVWHDAYYMTTDQFLGSDFAGSGIFAFNKASLLNGDPTAGFIYLDLGAPSTFRLGGFLPADLDGLTPAPAGTGGLIATYQATEYGYPQDALAVYEFRPDFANPAATQFFESAGSPVTVAAFDPTSPDGRNDIPQPAPGDFLDSQSDRLMYRVAYRNFGSHESLIVNQTVRAGTPYFAGVRLHELRRNNPTAPFAVNESSTIGAAGEHRWMGSAAQDHQGNLAVGYSLGSNEKKPSINYTGRLATEPAGTMRAEATLIEGTGVQRAFGFRWGDYSTISVDPVDDCSFWYTNQYYTQQSQDESEFGWLTRVGKFRFAECTDAPRGSFSGLVTNAANGQPIANARITASAVYSRATGSAGTYSAALPPNNYTVTASAFGFRSQTATVNLSNGANLTQNFALQPSAVIEELGPSFVTESCAMNGAAEPGENVTVSLPLRNTGSLPTANLTATLLESGGVRLPSAPQNYGVLQPGGNFVLRDFSFLVSPTLGCGGDLAMTFALQDGAENLGNLVVVRKAGQIRLTLNEGFAGPSPDLPAGWTTATEGAQPLWTKVLVEPPQNDYAMFSDEAIQPGVNELVTPMVAVTNPNAVLSFRNRYDLESTFLRNQLYDGGVLEIKIGSGAWQDILAAGSVFTSGAYDGPLSTCCSNPLAGRRAWSSKSGVTQDPVWITSQVQLPASAAGQNVQFRWRVATDIGSRRQGQWIDYVQLQDGYQCFCPAEQSRAPFDLDGDGRTDLSVFRPTDTPNASDFLYNASGSGAAQGGAWGGMGDVPTNADYDGDGKTDLAVFRPTTNTWFILRSSDNAAVIINFGLPGDKLTPADFDGDGKADIAVWRPATGVWYALRSTNGQAIIAQFGLNGDVPVQEDYDGDAKADFAVWRPATGVWWILRSGDGGFSAAAFGLPADKPVPGDFDGDGKGDLIVYRPSEGNWYLLRSQAGFAAVRFGVAGDKPLQADFDGDSRRDIALYRAGENTWYHLRSSNGGFAAQQFGLATDTQLPGIYTP